MIQSQSQPVSLGTDRATEAGMSLDFNEGDLKNSA